jgi:hypothetical protein
MQDVTATAPHAHPCRYMKDATVTAWEYTADQLAVWQQAGAPSVTQVRWLLCHSPSCAHPFTHCLCEVQVALVFCIFPDRVVCLSV